MMINNAFFDKNFQVFTDFRTTWSQQPLKTGRGMIDMAWVGPNVDEEEGKDLPSLITILNLHGDAQNHELQL